MAGIPHLWRPLSRGFTTTLGPPDTHVGAGMALAGGPQSHQEAPPQIPAGGQAGRRVPALPWDAPTHSAQAPGGAGPGTAAPLSPHSVGAAGLVPSASSRCGRAGDAPPGSAEDTQTQSGCHHRGCTFIETMHRQATQTGSEAGPATQRATQEQGTDLSRKDTPCILRI